jgi:hypothetical protein
LNEEQVLIVDLPFAPFSGMFREESFYALAVSVSFAEVCKYGFVVVTISPVMHLH